MPKLSPRRVLARLRPIALLSFGVLSLPAIPVCASAQSAPASLRACTAESDPALRLACYDRQMGRLSTPQPTARAKVAPAVVAPAVVAPAAVAATAKLSAHVARLERSPDAMVLYLDNGQVWEQIGRASGDLGLRAGDPVSIEEHFGSYWLSSRYIADMQVRRMRQPGSPAAAPTAAAAPTPVAPAPTVATPTPAVAPAAPPSPAAASAEKAASHWKAPWKIFTGGSSPRLTAHITRLERSPDAMVLHLDNGQVWQQIGRASGDLSLREGDEVRIEEHLGGYWLSSRYVSDMQVRLKPGD
jgi:hypothetical protein